METPQLRIIKPRPIIIPVQTMILLQLLAIILELVVGVQGIQPCKVHAEGVVVVFLHSTCCAIYHCEIYTGVAQVVAQEVVPLVVLVYVAFVVQGFY